MAISGPEHTAPRHFRSSSLILTGLLTVLVFSVYAQLITHEFTSYDDPYYITENVNIRQGLTPAAVSWALNTFRAGFWIPLTWISLIIDYQLFGLSAGGYLYVNLLLHITNCLLIFFLLRRMTGTVWRSFLVALLFGIHPLHVESVAWAVERKDVLSTLFFLLAIRAYLQYGDKPAAWRYALLVVFFVLSLMAKPMYVTLPLALLLLDYWPLDRWRADRPIPPGKKAVPAGSRYYPLVEKIPLLMIAAFFSFLNIAIAAATDIFTSMHSLTLPDRLANAVVCLLAYLEKFIWPQHLGILYPHPGDTLTVSQILPAAAAVIVITALGLLAGSRHRYLPVGWFWFLIVLLPVSGLFQNGHQAMADRFVYMPVLGLMIIAIWGGYDLLGRLKIPPWAGVLLVALITAALMVRTCRQVHYWENSLSLFTRTLAVTNDNYLMHDYAGVQWIQRGELDRAFRHFQAAIAINPRYAEAYFNAGTYLLFHGRWEEAENFLKRSLALGVKGENRRRAEQNLKRARRARQDPAAQIRILEKTLQLKPGDKAIQRSLDRLYEEQGLTGRREPAGGDKGAQEAAGTSTESTISSN